MMKLRFVADGVGPDKVRVSLKRKCGIWELSHFLDSCEKTVIKMSKGASPKMPTTTSLPCPSMKKSTPREDNFTPPTKNQRTILEFIADERAQTLDELCQEYGKCFDELSQQDVMDIIADFNNKSKSNKGGRKKKK